MTHSNGMSSPFIVLQNSINKTICFRGIIWFSVKNLIFPKIVRSHIKCINKWDPLTHNGLSHPTVYFEHVQNTIIESSLLANSVCLQRLTKCLLIEDFDCKTLWLHYIQVSHKQAAGKLVLGFI